MYSLDEEPGEDKFTTGKGFLHYAMPIKEKAGQVRNEQDNLSDVSSFRMDSDILSLDNAEFAMQSYNNNFYNQKAREDKSRSANGTSGYLEITSSTV